MIFGTNKKPKQVNKWIIKEASFTDFYLTEIVHIFLGMSSQKVASFLDHPVV